MAGRDLNYSLSHPIALCVRAHKMEGLGVRREGVTEAAGKLQADGLIQYSRGHIKVLDRAKLEKRVCECYAVVKKEFDRLLPYKIHGPPNTTT